MDSESIFASEGKGRGYSASAAVIVREDCNVSANRESSPVFGFGLREGGYWIRWFGLRRSRLHQGIRLKKASVSF